MLSEAGVRKGPAGQVSVPAFQPATATTAMTPSLVLKSAPESPSGTGRKFLLKEDNYTLTILL